MHEKSLLINVHVKNDELSKKYSCQNTIVSLNRLILIEIKNYNYRLIPNELFNVTIVEILLPIWGVLLYFQCWYNYRN